MMHSVLTTLAALDDGRLRDRTRSWVMTLSITLIAFLLRFHNLGFPNKILFDETYYAKDAWALLQSGYERNWSENANDLLVHGDTSGMQNTPEFMVHPPLGKLLIGWGEQLFGMNSFGWRFASLIFGTLLVLFTIRLARRLSRSTLVGGIAGVLLTFDGLAFVMSRIALLDIFQATFAVAAISALVADRDWFRHRLADHLRAEGLEDLGGSFGPLFLLRPWRIVAGILLGASCAVKWNSIYLLAAFGILVVCWDFGARRLAGADTKRWLSLAIDAPMAFLQLVVAAVPVYLATWYRWLTTTGGYDRDWGSKNPDAPSVRLLGDALASLMQYHKVIYEFHVGDYMSGVTHAYDANPAGWLLMLRPIGIEAVNDIAPGTDGCQAVGTTCIRVISGMGTPILWWAALVAILFAIYWWVAKRDWRFGVPLTAIAAMWLPWFRYTDRPQFFFYAIMIIPFSVTILAMALGKVLGPPDSPHRMRRSVLVGALLAVIIWNFAFIYPILTADLLTKPQWWWRMWFGNAWV